MARQLYPLYNYFVHLILAQLYSFLPPPLLRLCAAPVNLKRESVTDNLNSIIQVSDVSFDTHGVYIVIVAWVAILFFTKVVLQEDPLLKLHYIGRGL